MLNKIMAHTLFFRQFLRAPAQTGSICPSGIFLVHALVDGALSQAACSGLIVDLGAGSGVVSRQLLKSGVSPDHILAVDISDNFRNIFSKNCRGVELCTGDARHLEDLISSHSPRLPLQAIISSLPLRAMPGPAVAEIMLEALNILKRRGGVFIQYTYAFWMRSALARYGFIISGRRFVPVNLPPALVELYIPRGEPIRGWPNGTR